MTLPKWHISLLPHPLPHSSLHLSVPRSSQADPEAEKKDEADPTNQAEVLHIKIRLFLFLFLLLFLTIISDLYLSFDLVFITLLFSLFARQAAKEEEEKVEDGMWEETFKSHTDGKPNGRSSSLSSSP